MLLSFLLDEHLRGPLWKAIHRHNIESEYSIDATRVGDPPDLPLGSSDPEILQWAQRESRILVTLDEHTIPVYLANHLKAGRQSPGIFVLRGIASLASIVSFLEAVAHASDAEEWRNRIEYVP